MITTLKTRLAKIVLHAGIKERLIGAFVGVASLTLLASVVAFFSYNYIGGSLHRVETQGIPLMIRALTFARQSAEYSMIASALEAAANSAELSTVVTQLKTKSAEMTATLDGFKNGWIAENVLVELGDSVKGLSAGTGDAASAVGQRLMTTRDREQLVDRAIAMHRGILDELTQLLDDVSFELAIGLESLGQVQKGAATADVARSQRNDALLLNFTDIRQEINVALGILFEVSLATNESLLTPLRDRFIASRDRAAKAVASLAGKGPVLPQAVNALFEFGFGPNNLFEARRSELDAIRKSYALLAASHAKAAALAIEVQRSVKIADERTSAAVAAAKDTILKSQVLLAVLAAFSLASAVIFVSIYVGRGLLTRLAKLNEAILALAGGNLDIAIPHEGHDELSRIATAVEVFKQNAIEARQLEFDKEKDRIADLKQREASFRLLFKSNPVPMWVYDRKTLSFLSVNDAAVAYYGYSCEQFLTMTPLDLRPIADRAAVAEFLRNSDPNHQGEEVWPHIRSDGSQFDVVIYSRALSYYGVEAVLVAVMDISERKRAEARIAYMAHHDALTELPNRVLFRERLQDLLKPNPRDQRGVAVLLLDLDRFKEVNDTLGHAAGDTLLVTVAQRLLKCVRDGDTVARLGGDEFAIIQRVADPAIDAAALAKRIQEIVAAPFEIENHDLEIGTTIGIVTYPGDGTDPDQLLKHADLALYRAKEEGRGTFRFFEPEMDQRARARHGLEKDLRQALVNGEFRVHYQASVNIQRNEIAGFEALLRWTRPNYGDVSPADFIPLAEETGLIIPIGEWVLREACAEAARWPAHLTVAVNLSPAQFKYPALIRSVVDALAAARLAPERLELEVTESITLQDGGTAFAILRKLSEIGVKIALDDFGTGYSSLSNLRRFPFDKIKIDRSFVNDLSHINVDAVAMVRSVAQLGVALGITTTAEGVETQEQLDTVRIEGCTEMQGFLFSRPIPASEIGELLSKQQKAVFNPETKFETAATGSSFIKQPIPTR